MLTAESCRVFTRARPLSQAQVCHARGSVKSAKTRGGSDGFTPRGL
jgi:hypothetical protein